MNACQAGIESQCKYCCDDDDSLTCQFCEANIKTACPSTSGLEFLADTGSEEDLISRVIMQCITPPFQLKTQLDNC